MFFKSRTHATDARTGSTQAWRRHPLRTALRLLPLSLKEAINHRLPSPLFDLSFYLQFQPSSLDDIGGRVKFAPEEHTPGSRRRVAFVTPHLGPGGAEQVLLEIMRALDRARTEIFLIATHSRDSRWVALWHQHADHVFDLATLYDPEVLPSAVYSLIVNWQMDTVVLQNTLIGYYVMPLCRRDLPNIRLMDLVHAVGMDWDLTRVTQSVSPCFDIRIAVSAAVCLHLIATGTLAQRVHHIPNGVDLERFRPAPLSCGSVFRILFAARLDPIKRPRMLVDIARALSRIEPLADFCFTVAGDGPEYQPLRRLIENAGLNERFDLLGHVDDLAPVLATSDVLIVTSANEGIPLVILEAFATARPVIASCVGAIEEVVNDCIGVLIDSQNNEVNAFARALSVLLRNADLRLAMGDQARHYVERNFNRLRSVELYRAILS